MSDRDYYEILGLTPRADGAMVDQAYWHLARKYQALAETNPRATAMLDELNEAYGVLGTPRLREQYDAFRDEVLIGSGVIQPVTSKPRKATKTKAAKNPKPTHPTRERETVEHRLDISVPRPSLPALPKVRLSREQAAWASCAVGAAALMAGGLWLGLSPLLVVGALSAISALAFTRVLKRQLPDISLTLPQVSVPDIKAPRIDAGEIPRCRPPLGSSAKAEPVDADELRASTAAMISRWRNQIGLRAPAPAAVSAERSPLGDDPSTELVDIVRSERELDSEDAPLAAVIDILRGSGR